jgi:hypothetical protein
MTRLMIGSRASDRWHVEDGGRGNRGKEGEFGLIAPSGAWMQTFTSRDEANRAAKRKNEEER